MAEMMRPTSSKLKMRAAVPLGLPHSPIAGLTLTDGHHCPSVNATWSEVAITIPTQITVTRRIKMTINIQITITIPIMIS